MTGFPSWSTSEVVTAAKMRKLSLDYVTKGSDESVTSSTTLQNDDALAYTVAAAGTYAFEINLAVTSAADAAGDVRIGFTFPTGTMHFFGIGPDVSLASGNIGTGHFGTALSATSGTTALAFGASTTAAAIRVYGQLIATATGTLQLQWAQQSSSGSATTVKAGSFMIVRQVA